MTSQQAEAAGRGVHAGGARQGEHRACHRQGGHADQAGTSQVEEERDG